MHLLDGRPVYSAGDLVGFLACEHLTDLERAALAGLTSRPERNDPELDLIRRRGFEHEKRYRDELQVTGRHVTEIQPDAAEDGPEGSRDGRGDKLRRQARQTLEAMHRGDDVIYQAAFFDGRWRGHADFLLRVDGPQAGSELGAYHYEISDTKLAHKTKASALVQLCTYVDLLAPLQGRVPDQVHVALGGSARLIESHRVADYLAYYRALRARFEAAVSAESAPEPGYPPLGSYPDPVEHCDVCSWLEICRQRWRADDHLSLVAGITRNQRRALTGRAVATRRTLAVLPLPVTPPLEQTSREAVARVRQQARIQVEGEDAGTILYELLEPEKLDDGSVLPARGLAALPPPSIGDLFFDIEGDPFAFEDGLEYLFGVIEPGASESFDQATLWPSEPPASGSRPDFHFRWALDPVQEKQGFEWFVDLVMARRERDPGLHVYHFGSYERGRVARLSTRHATREAEVDVLLRAGTFVDLFNVVRQGIRASVESYSIKRLEPLYSYRRTVDLRLAGDSIVEFERYLEEGSKDDSILETIRQYNRDDCLSTWHLRDWLEARRLEAETHFAVSLPRPSPTDGEPSDQQNVAHAEVQDLAQRLTAGIPQEEEAQSPEEKARLLLANLLDWHWREGKSTWWRFYDLMSRPDDELELAREPVAQLEFDRDIPLTGQQRKPIRRYRFPPQENELDVDSDVHDPRLLEVTPLGRLGTVVAINQLEGWVDIRLSADPALPHPTALVPTRNFPTDSHRRCLMTVGESVAQVGMLGPGPYRAARDLLLRAAPRVGQLGAGRLPDEPAGDELNLPGEDGAQAALRLVHSLDETTLAIQGPPGSGKSTSGAEMILRLVAAGQRVGITANSHKVIGALLEKICAQADARGQSINAVQRANKGGQGHVSELVELVASPQGVRAKLDAGEAQVAAGTSWLWTSPAMADSVDVLFVDEAGQMSLANALAVSLGARSLVLLGDPQQLEQPVQGSHPPGAGASALEHLLDGRQTIEGHRGLFLEHTWRLHPDVCRFTSELFYEGRLDARDHLGRQAVHWPEPLGGTGLRWIPIRHVGNHSRSDEEAAEVVRVATSLVQQGAQWTEGDGRRKALGWPDILIVAPYNAQVRAIRDRLPEEARGRVGTVDKFQGQQGAVVLYSMTTSSPEEAPHGMEFLYSLNRLNVATSRAKCLAVLVASPELLRVRCRTPRQMRLANALCRFAELASVVPPIAEHPGGGSAQSDTSAHEAASPSIIDTGT